MDEAGLRQQLDNALLTESEMAAGPQSWARLHDPVPAWFN